MARSVVGLSFHVSLISFFPFPDGVCVLDVVVVAVWAWHGSARRWNVGGTANILFNRNKWTRVHMVSSYVCPFSGESDPVVVVGGERDKRLDGPGPRGSQKSKSLCVAWKIDGIRTVICSVKMQI